MTPVLAAKIEHWPIGRLIPYARNARTHSPAQVEQIARSIQTFGFTNPILVDGARGVLAGHGRLQAAQRLKLAIVPVIVLDHLSEAERRAYILADNKLAEHAGWDDELLAAELAEIKAMDFGLDVIGFDEKELEKLLGAPADDAADECPDVPERAVTAAGDLWLLGRHRVLCGDATNAEDVARVMAGAKADMVFTDPPYGMGLDTDFTSAKSNLRMIREKGLLGGHKYAAVIGDDKPFDPSAIIEAFSDCSEQFWWGADYYADCIPSRNTGSWIIWDKRLDESADLMYGSCFETCWSRQRHKRDIARVKWAGVFGTEHEQAVDGKKRVHPTQKPVALVMWFFARWGAADDNVIDLFGGSGSTLLACEKTDRNARLLELSPEYCDVIVKRWQIYTGKPATRERDGRTFDACAADEIDIPLNTPAGQVMLGARDWIAEEAFAEEIDGSGV